MSKMFTVEDDYQDSRFDRWFKQKVINLPQSLLEKIIRQNKIKVNKLIHLVQEKGGIEFAEKKTTKNVKCVQSDAWTICGAECFSLAWLFSPHHRP